jgi:hypothetical protein
VGLRRAIAHDEHLQARELGCQMCRREYEQLRRLLAGEPGHGADHRSIRRDAQLSADVAPWTGQRRNPVRDDEHVARVDALDLDHAAHVLGRDGEERVGAAGDQLAIQQAAQRPSLVRPGVLMSDDDGHAGQPSDQRPPYVGPEFVGVQDVDPAATQCGAEPNPRDRIRGPAALEAKELDARATEFRECRRDHVGVGLARVPARRAQRRREPPGIEPRGRLDCQPLAAAGEDRPVDENEDAYLVLTSHHAG